ncbi:matrixin [Halomicroarcula sp. F13]|uniref:Matrixin n=1 Tax=Haloarcula rubra TaxID=2487747 RepID=A0AAW4PVK3_9EURY|nr:matrixin [Halomicroarcula rubra]MBX0324262.1 matrixin [Halomicroarcula rubra]
MDRRLIALVLCLLLGGLAGCSAASEALDSTSELVERGHPLANETVTVVVDGTDRERALAADGLAYWEANAPEYAGFDVAFRVLEPGETPADGPPDVEITFVETVTDCGGSDYSAGCAPRLDASTRVDRPAEVSIKRGFADESTRLVVEHEVGHLLGLRHGDPPRAVMRHRSTLATLPRPNASERPVPWNDTTLTVAVRNESLSVEERTAYREEVAYALAYVSEGADGTVPSNVSAELVADPDAADVVVTPVASSDCRSDAGSCLLVEGTDPDRDGAIETYTRAEILLVDLDSEAASWHVARQLLGVLGDDRLPDRLTDASYRTRRGAWHG